MADTDPEATAAEEPVVLLPNVPYEQVRLRSETDLLDTWEREFIDIKIADAVALILDECPTVPARLESGALSRNNYYRVVSDVVLRVLRNPGGLDSESEGGYSYSARATVASGDFWLTDRDRRTLLGLQSKRLPGTVGIDADYGWAR